jgi:hypothetical protein
MMHLTYFADITQLIYSASGLVLQIGIGLGIIFIIKAAVETVGFLGKITSRVSGATKGVTDAARERVSRGRNLRKQAKEQYRQRQFLERAATGKGVRGRMFRASSRMSMGAGARAEMTESLQSQQQKLLEQRMATQSSAIGDEAGSIHSAAMAHWRRGESASQFQQRYKAEKGVDLDEKILSRMQQRFGSQIGTTDFRVAALLAAHQTGSDLAEVSSATGEVARALMDSGMTQDEANNFMIKRINSSAKANGFQSLAYAGISPSGPNQGKYDEAAIKGGVNAAGVDVGMRQTAGSVDLEKMEKAQIYDRDPVTGALTTRARFGDALFDVSTADPVAISQAASRLARTIQGPGKAATKEEVKKLVSEISAHLATTGYTSTSGGTFEEEVKRIIEGRT